MRLINLVFSTDIFSKRRKICAWKMKKTQSWFYVVPTLVSSLNVASYRLWSKGKQCCMHAYMYITVNELRTSNLLNDDKVLTILSIGIFTRTRTYTHTYCTCTCTILITSCYVGGEADGHHDRLLGVKARYSMYVCSWIPHFWSAHLHARARP